jgi:hypothetical protein
MSPQREAALLLQISGLGEPLTISQVTLAYELLVEGNSQQESRV